MPIKIKVKQKKAIIDLIQSAQTFYEINNFNESEHICKNILRRQPNNFTALHLLGKIKFQTKRIDEAIEYFKRALAIKPNDANIYNNLGLSIQESGQIEKAILYYQKAIQLNPNLSAAYFNLGNAFKDNEQLNEAIASYQKALQLNPKFTKVYTNMGVVFSRKKQFNEAIACHNKVLELNPDFIEAQTNLGSILLILGNFREGWKKYEFRWQTKEFIASRKNFTHPHWEGSSLRGKTLFIYAEQGIGDEIMFASCFSDVINNAELCIIECDNRLIPLFSRSFYKAKFIEKILADRKKTYTIPSVDFVIAMGSLPLYLRNSLADFPLRESYLLPDKQKVNIWQSRFKSLGEGLKIGISWQGGKEPYAKKTRSISIGRWKSVFTMPNIHLISLQYGDRAKELKDIKEKMGVIIHDWEDADPLKDLDNFAAEISALDLVISVDNATVHMAGALGVDVWTLLPFASECRWMLNREDSPWYPTMRLFRQSSPGDWGAVIAQVKDELQKLLGNN